MNGPGDQWDAEVGSIGTAYFLIRIQSAGSSALAPLSGAAERLATGEKQAFDTADELIRLLRLWSTETKMPPPGEGGKTGAADLAG